MTTPLQHLRGQVSKTTAETTRFSIVLHTLFGQAEVSQFSVTLRVDNHIVRLQIPKYDVTLMQTLNSQ